MEIRDIVPRRWINWDLESTFGSFERDLSRMLRELRRGFDESGKGMAEFNPKTNVTENEKAIRITVELPGVDEKDVKVSLNEYGLNIRGEKRLEKEEKNEDHHLIERVYGEFSRVIGLPREVDREKVDANFKKGVLTVTIPKTEKAQASAKEIAVKAG